MQNLTPRQQQIFDLIKDKLEQTGYPQQGQKLH